MNFTKGQSYGSVLIIGAIMNSQAPTGIYAYRVIDIFSRKKSLITPKTLRYLIQGCL